MQWALVHPRSPISEQSVKASLRRAAASPTCPLVSRHLGRGRQRVGDIPLVSHLAEQRHALPIQPGRALGCALRVRQRPEMAQRQGGSPAISSLARRGEPHPEQARRTCLLSLQLRHNPQVGQRLGDLTDVPQRPPQAQAFLVELQRSVEVALSVRQPAAVPERPDSQGRKSAGASRQCALEPPSAFAQVPSAPPERGERGSQA
jgi:hypothetical protein